MSGSQSPVRVAVFEPDATTLIAQIPRRRGVQWMNEANTAGTAQFEFPLDDPLLVKFPHLLDPFNVVKFYVGDTPVKGWIIESLQPVQAAQGEGADRWVTVSGRGGGSALESAVTYPDTTGLGEQSLPWRVFTFASVANSPADPDYEVGDPSWYIDANWHTVTTSIQYSRKTPNPWRVPIIKGFGIRGYHYYPERTQSGAVFDWPDSKAEWIWYNVSNQYKAKPGHVYFRREWTNTKPMDIVIYATADNQLNGLYFDGIDLGQNLSKVGYKTVVIAKVSSVLPGTHVLAAKCTNLAGSTKSTKNNPAGFLMTGYQLDSNGARTSNHLFRTNTTTGWVATGYSDPEPGWAPAWALYQLVREAAGRNVTTVSPITANFTATHDTAGNAWMLQAGISAPIGTQSLSDYLTQVVELGCDVDFSPDFVMSAWLKRGTDKSKTVRITPMRDVLATTAQVQAQTVRNQALVQYGGQWIELYSSASQDLYGRREVGMSLGSSSAGTTAIAATEAALAEVIDVNSTVTTTYSSLSGPQPYVDYDIGDYVSVPTAMVAPGKYVNFIKARVMQITGSEQSEGYVQWDLSFYPATPLDDVAFVQAITNTYDVTSNLYESEVLTDSPWGFWRLQETSGTNFDDKSTRDYDQKLFTATGSTFTYTHVDSDGDPDSGPVEAAVRFDDVTHSMPLAAYNLTYMQTQVSPSKTFNYKDASFEVWFKMGYTPGANMYLLSGDNQDAQEQFILFIGTAGKVNWRVFDHTGAANTVTSPNNLCDDVWHHAVGTVSVNRQRLYIDGVLVDNGSIPNRKLATHGYQVIVRGGNDADIVWIAEPAVYNYELLASRVSRHYNITLTPSVDPVTGLGGSATTSVTLTWTNPSSSTFAGTWVVRRAGSTAPTAPSDGTLVADVPSGTAGYVDTTVAASTTYSYTLFTHDDAMNFGPGASVTVTTT